MWESTLKWFVEKFLINYKISTNLYLMVVFSEPLFVKIFAKLPISMCAITNLTFWNFHFCKTIRHRTNKWNKIFLQFQVMYQKSIFVKTFLNFFFWQIFEFSNTSFESRSKTKPSTIKIWIQVPKLELIEVCRHFDESLVSASKNSIDV